MNRGRDDNSMVGQFPPIRTNSLLKDYSVEFVLILFLYTMLFMRIIPATSVFAVILCCQLFRLDYISNTIMFFFFLNQFLGLTLGSIGMTGYGGYSIIVGFLLIVYGLFTKRVSFTRWLPSLVLFVLLISFFVISMMTSSGGDFAETKLSRTVFRGISSLIVFIILFSNISKINTGKLGIYLMIYGLYLLSLSIEVNMIAGPSGLFDFGFLRLQSGELLSDDDVYHINTHFPGLYSLQGLSIFLIKNSHNRKIVWCLMLVCLVTSLYAGARQMIVTAFVILLLWMIKEYRKSVKGWLTLLVLALSVFLFIRYLYFSTGVGLLFESTVEEGYLEGGSRGPLLLKGISDFIEHPAFGVGFGRYNFLGYTYPHNLVVEILAEMGVFGFVVLFSLASFVMVRYRHLLTIIGYYLIAIFLMSMASGAMYDNIIVFTLLFALPSLSESTSDASILRESL